MKPGNTRQYLLLGATIVCIAGLYLVGTASEPASISLVNLAEHEGEEVQVTGLVVYVERYDRAASFVLRDGPVSARIFSPDGTAARQGDQVRVTGTVQRYQGMLEIVAENIAVVEHANTTVQLPVLAERYSDFLDTTVTTAGSAANVTPDSFRLVDGCCSINVRHPSGACTVTPGDRVAVTAMLRYDPEAMCFYLSIERSAHGIERQG